VVSTAIALTARTIIKMSKKELKLYQIFWREIQRLSGLK